MASRRMMMISIIDSDDFLDLPLSAQALYFHYIARADDDGILNNYKKITRMIGADDSDLTALIDSNYIIKIDNIIVISHWCLHNRIPKDRYKKTLFQKEFSLLCKDDNEMYTLCKQNDNKPVTQGSEVNSSKEKDSEGSSSIEDDQLTYFKGPVMLSENQISDLLERLGLESFVHYVDKLAYFIEEKGAYVKSHYATILKWYEEDSEVKKG